MAREHIQDGENLENEYLKNALERRQNDFIAIDDMIQAINDSMNDITSIVIGIERHGNITYKNWVGSLNGCYGLAHRLQLDLEANMSEFEGEFE